MFAELKQIYKRNRNDIVIIDDVHTFGKVRNELKEHEMLKEWELVTEQNLVNFFDKKVFDSQVVGDAFVIWLKGTPDA